MHECCEKQVWTGQVGEDQYYLGEDVSGRLDRPRLALLVLSSGHCRWPLKPQTRSHPSAEQRDAEIHPYKTEPWHTQDSV